MIANILFIIFIWCLWAYPIFHLLGWIDTRLMKLRRKNKKYKLTTGQIDAINYFVGITLLFGGPSLILLLVT